MMQNKRINEREGIAVAISSILFQVLIYNKWRAYF